MKPLALVVLLAIALAKSSAAVISPHPDYVPDEKTAVQISEAVLVAQFGRERVNLQLPLQALSIGTDTWLVEGTIKDALGRPQVGGAFGVWINKHSGCVSIVEHIK